MAWSMIFRIETAAQRRFTVFILSGRIETQAIAELRSGWLLFLVLQKRRAVARHLPEPGQTWRR